MKTKICAKCHGKGDIEGWGLCPACDGTGEERDTRIEVGSKEDYEYQGLEYPRR